MGKILSMRLTIAMSAFLFSLTLVMMVAPAYASPGTITITGKLEYVNEWGGFSPMRRVKVYLMDNDMWEGWPWDEQVAWQYTDDAGNFAFTVNNDDGLWQDGRDPYVRVESSNPAAVAMSASSVIYSMQLPQAGENVMDGFVYDYGSNHPDVNNEAWQAIDAVLSVRDWIWSQVSWERPTKVNIYWPSGGWPCSYGDAIHLPHESLWTWDHVSVYHEYGVSVLYTIYGNTFPTGYMNSVPPQSVFAESSTVFAFVEGWASFIQCAVDNNPDNLVDWHGGHGGNIETNDWFNCIDEGYMDGEIVEGSVASILWDIFDPVNDEPLDFGFDEIFYTMGSQKPTHFTSFWNWWVLHYPASAGDLSTICWVYGIDKDFCPPTGSIIINGGDTYTTSTSVTLTLSASDYGSGVAYMRFSNNPDAPSLGTWFPELVWSDWYPYATSASWTLTAGDGEKTVYAQFMDTKGLMTPHSSLPRDTIILDISALTASIVINGDDGYTASRDVILTLAYSDAIPGVDVVRYRNDGETWTAWEPPLATRAWTLRDLDGTRTVFYQVRDKAGLVSDPASDTIILDRAPPWGSIVINTGNTYAKSISVTLSLSNWDATSGVSMVRYRNFGEAWKPWEAPSATKAWILTSGDGTKTVYYEVQDYAGNSYVTSDDIILDSTPPTTTAGHANPSSTVILTRSDGLSGVAATYYRIGSNPWSTSLYPPASVSFTLPTPLNPTTHVIEYYSVDKAGNQENPKTLKVHYLSITAYPPEIWTPPSGAKGWYTEGATVAWSTIPTPPGSKWVDRTAWPFKELKSKYTFSTWKLDGITWAPADFLMNGPHNLMATYFGLDIMITGHHSSDGNWVLHMKVRIVTGDTEQVNVNYRFYADIDDWPDEDYNSPTYSLGTIPGGLDIEIPFNVEIPKSISVPWFVDYVRMTVTIWVKDGTGTEIGQCIIKLNYG